MADDFCGTGRPSEDRRRLGFGSTTRTEISGLRHELANDGERYEAVGDTPGAIQVQRDVYQTKVQRQ